MTGYAVDEDNNTLIRIWATARGQRAAAVGPFPAAAPPESQLRLAGALTSLSGALWRCYTHPSSAAGSLEANTEGWRRQQTREGFADVVPTIRKPNLPADDGALYVSYDPVEERAHRVGRALHELGDAALVDAVCADVSAELAAVEAAELGDLSGRAVQAVVLSRAGASPVQVATADAILNQDPLAGGQQLFDLDPTAASVAAAHWLKAAADVVARVSHIPASEVLSAADDLEALPTETPNEVLELFDFSDSAYRIVVDMVSSAMLVAEGVAADLDALVSEEDDEHGGDDEASAVRLTPLDPRRPALDLLEDLLTAIGGCRLLYGEYADPDDEDDATDDEFMRAVREEAETNDARLV